MITSQQLIEAGYNRSISHGSKQFTNVLYQKRFDDEHGKRYFINVWEWDNRDFFKKRGYKSALDNDFSYQAESQFTYGYGTVFNIELLANDSIKQIEAFFAETWDRLGCAYYETF